MFWERGIEKKKEGRHESKKRRGNEGYGCAMDYRNFRVSTRQEISCHQLNSPSSRDGRFGSKVGQI